MSDAIWIEQDGLAATVDDHHVATVQLRRPPNNFFDVAMIGRIVPVPQWAGRARARGVFAISSRAGL
jgi:hypothetical protein